MSIRLSLIPAVSLLLLTTGCVPLAVGGAATGGVAVAQERSVGSAIDDTAIRTRIWNRYLHSDTPNLYSNIAVKVVEGRVLLTGPVDSADSAARAVQLAWEVEGVREVINEITITERADHSKFPQDAWITTQVKSRLLAEKGVRSINYTIETVHGVVYIMGLAQSEDELARVLNVASRVKGVTQVISHARLKTDPLRTEPPAPTHPAPVQQTTPAYDDAGAVTPQQQDYYYNESPSNDTYRYDSYDGGADSPFTPQY